MAGNVIVAGGLGALGRVIAVELVARNWNVAIADLATAAAPSGMVAMGGVDLADENAVAAAYAQIAKRLGAIHALVNVAGGFLWEPVSGGKAESFDRMYRINLRTAAVSARAALEYLTPLPGGGGGVVNVGAAASLQPGVGVAAYSAAKAGVKALTESLAEELRSKGVRVNAVLPTILDTPANRADMPDANFATWIKPAAAAAVIAFLLSAEAGAVTGASIPLNFPAIR